MLYFHRDSQVRELRATCSRTQVLERLIEALSGLQIPDRALEFAGKRIIAVVGGIAQRHDERGTRLKRNAQ